MASAQVEQFVWEKWRRVWYMGRVVEVQLAPPSGGDANTPASTATATATLVKVHIHGELDTNDKWVPPDSANLVRVAVVPNDLAAIGAFPALHDCVELLQMDAVLYELLRAAQPRDSGVFPLLIGIVVQALPAHDASVVNVLYPPEYHHVVRERRVHIGNGYLNVISEREFQERSLRLQLGSSPLGSLSTQ